MHAALSDFWWLAEDLANRPTCLYKLVTLPPTIDGYHDTSGTMCGGVLLLGPNSVTREIQAQPSTALSPPDLAAPHPIF